MDVRQAISKAKEYFNDLFSEEKIAEAGLEEVVFDENRDMWMITIGFARASYPLNRWYKFTTIDKDGNFKSATNRETTHA